MLPGQKVFTYLSSFLLSEKWGGFIENYSEIVQRDYNSRFDTGLSYAAENDLAFEVSFGCKINAGISDFL